MPLKKGKKNIGKNISKLESEGKSHEQVVAIAISVSKKKPKKR